MTTCLGNSCSFGLPRTFRKLLSAEVFSYFPFGFHGRIWDLIVSVPDHCLSFYFEETKTRAIPSRNGIHRHSSVHHIFLELQISEIPSPNSGLSAAVDLAFVQTLPGPMSYNLIRNLFDQIVCYCF